MSNNVIVKNRDYSLYLAGVINEEQFMRLCDDGMSELGGISLRLESVARGLADGWSRMVEEDMAMDDSSKGEVKGAIDFFKNSISMLTGKVSEYASKGNEFILDKANRVLDVVENWRSNNGKQADEIEKIARGDSKHFKSTFFDKLAMTDREPQIGESVMSAVGNFAIITMFKMMKFVLFELLSVLLRTALNSMRQIFTAEAKGAKFMVNFVIAVMFPLVVFAGTAGSGLLIPAGLFYMVQILKSVYEQATGQPYLR